MIVEGLRRLQEEAGYLTDEGLKALAERLDVPLHRLHEVASFFPHFRLVPGPAVCVKVCRDLACRLRGAPRLHALLVDRLRQLGDPSRVAVREVSCLGRCDGAPAVLVELNRVGQHEVCRTITSPATSDAFASIEAIARAHLEDRPLPTEPCDDAPRPWLIDPYRGSEPQTSQPYAALAQFAEALRAAPSVEERKRVVDRFLEVLKASELRGMGGAGKPAVLKWSEARQTQSDHKYVVCNADESEPATFKDRELLLRTPYLIVEGMALAALVVGANRGYVYIRHEYYDQIRIMNRAIADARSLGVVGPNVLQTGQPFELEVFISPGGYVCGEQGALMEAIEERRSEPRNRPPEPETNGLFDKPTVLNNVETFAWVPSIMLRGAAWYAEAGLRSSWYEKRNKPAPKGQRFFSICGDVARPGVFETRIGQTLGELIDRAGGIRDGLPLLAVAPSGPSGGFIPAQIAGRDGTRIDVRDLPLDIDEFRTVGQMLGAGIVIYAAQAETSILDQAASATRFFRDESCGKCVPCRVGSYKLAEVAERVARGELAANALLETKTLVDELNRVMELTSICGLGASAAKPLVSALHYFCDIPKAARNG